MGKDLYFSSIVTKSLDPINSEERFFEGYLTVEVKDKQGEITVVDELYKVLPVWMDRGAPISDTHSNRIIGKGINFARATYKSEGQEIPAIKITGKIHKNYELDNEIWNKIKSGEYKGLSFGGATKANRTPKVMKDGSVAYQLTDLEHYEVAVCKDPAVPLALITDFNPVAKAMADHTEDRDGKMLIKCSKFGCRIDLEKAEKKEPKLTEGGKKVLQEATTVADLYKVDLRGIETFEGKVEALMDEGKSRESAEKIVGSFTKKFDDPHSDQDEIARIDPNAEDDTEEDEYISEFERESDRLQDAKDRREKIPYSFGTPEPKKKYDDAFEKKYPYFHDGNDDTCAHCGGDLTCLHCGEYHGGGDHHKTPHTNEDMENSMQADAWENHPELTEDDVVEFPHKKGRKPKKKTDYSDDESKENRKKLIDRYGENEFVDRHGKKGRKPVDKDAPTGHDPTQVAHSPDTPREMELEKGKDLSNTAGDTSSMYNQNGAEQRVNSKKAECPHCGKHFKHEETPYTDVPYEKDRDPDYVLTLNEKELEEYEKKKGAVGGEVPPQWTGNGSPYPKGERKVIKRKKVIKTSSWKDLKNKAFDLDMQWRVIDLVKDSMDGKGDNKPKKGDAPQSHADQSEDIKNLGYELDGSHEEGETIGIGRDWDGTVRGLFYKQPKQGKAPIKGKKKEGFTYERDHDPENHVGRETKDHARTGSAQQAQYDGTEGKSQSKEKPLKQLTGGELEEVEKLKSLTMELKDALRDEAVPEQLARPRKPKRFEGNLSKEPSDSQQQAEDARRYSEDGGREGRKPFKSTKWRDYNPRTGGEGGRTDRSGQEGLLQPTRRGEKVHTHEGKERGGKSKKIGIHEVGDIITNPYNRRYVSSERQPTGRRRSEANERDRKAREAKRNEEARLSIKALSKKLTEELKEGTNAANGTSPRGGDFSGTTDDGKFNVRHNGGRKTNRYGRRAEDLGNFP